MTLTNIIQATDSATNDTPLDAVCKRLGVPELLAECDALELFRRESGNLYHRVRALFFLSAIHRFHLPARPELAVDGRLPYAGVDRLLARRFDEAVRLFRAEQAARNWSDRSTKNAFRLSTVIDQASAVA